jgi:hypothetical protein
VRHVSSKIEFRSNDVARGADVTNAAEPFNGTLKIETDPFASNAANHPSSRQVQTAFREIVGQIVEQTPVVLVTAPASAGKTLLVDMTARLCPDMGLSVRRVHRGDLLHRALDQQSDVLLVDEANSVEDSILEAFSPKQRTNTATTTVFLGLPSCVARFIASVNPVLIQFDLLSRSDAEHYLHERATGAGFSDLFAEDTLELIVNASCGSPRSLRTIASVAFFNAASDRAFQIGHKHAASALAMQLPPSGATLSHRAKQGVAAENTGVPRAKGYDSDSASEKTASRGEGVLPRVKAAADEPIPAAEVAISVANLAQSIGQKAKELGDDIRIGTPDGTSAASLETSSRHSVAHMSIVRGLLAACLAIVVTAVAIATVRPWVLTGPVVPTSTARPQSLPAAVRTSGAADSTAASPAIANQAENKFEPEPIAGETKNTPQAEKENAGSTGLGRSSAREIAEPKAAVRKPLTAEEKAAIARGIQEMEKAATQASAPVNRR